MLTFCHSRDKKKPITWDGQRLHTAILKFIWGIRYLSVNKVIVNSVFILLSEEELVFKNPLISSGWKIFCDANISTFI